MNQRIETKYLNELEDWQEGSLPIQWIILPERQDLAAFLRQQGYCMVDRTMRATIFLEKSSDFARFCRIPLERMEQPTERIYEIAEQSFLLDSRFLGNASASREDIRQQIRCFVHSMGAFHVCRCKGIIAGFLEIAADRETPGKQAAIRLAAVDETYRVAGTALSLYAGIADLCREQGLQKLWGRISSRNMPVLNLYAALGASFSLPQDVYVRM